MHVESIVCSYIDGTLVPPTSLRDAVREYAALAWAIKSIGRSSKAVDDKMNAIFDSLVEIVGWMENAA